LQCDPGDIRESSPEDDMKRAIDLYTPKGSVSFRIRGHEYLSRYPGDITIRKNPDEWFKHKDGRTRLLTVEGAEEWYTISMLYESGECSEYAGITLSEAQRWFREQGQALMCIGFFPVADNEGLLQEVS
jgi:hypothetical protein